MPDRPAPELRPKSPAEAWRAIATTMSNDTELRAARADRGRGMEPGLITSF